MMAGGPSVQGSRVGVRHIAELIDVGVGGIATGEKPS